MVKKYRAILAYDGTAYSGFQRQAAGIPTIQGAVEQAILRLTQQEAVVTGAGRTDTGVHATGQVITFHLAWRHDPETLLRALNVNLPADIALQSLMIEPDERFHPRFSAKSRLYHYTVVYAPVRQPLLRQYAWVVNQPLDIVAMQSAAELLIGQHDFATFGKPPYGENTVRHVFQSWWQQHIDSKIHHYGYTIEATAFLHHMVRRIVGMLVGVGRGLLTVEQFSANFREADLSLASVLAPPEGLVLRAVHY